MPTTSDLTLRVDGEQVDNLELSRGQSIDFSFESMVRAFPSNLVSGFGYRGIGRLLYYPMMPEKR